MYQLTESIDVEVGEAVPGVPIAAQGVEYVVEAHMTAEEIAGMMADTSEMSEEEMEQVAVMLTGDTEVNQAAVAISDAEGSAGPVIVQEDDLSGEAVLEQFEADYLSA